MELLFFNMEDCRKANLEEDQEFDLGPGEVRVGRWMSEHILIESN